MSDTPRTERAKLAVFCDEINGEVYYVDAEGGEYAGGVCREDEMAEIERELIDAQNDLRLMAGSQMAVCQWEAEAERLKGLVEAMRKACKAIKNIKVDDSLHEDLRVRLALGMAQAMAKEALDAVKEEPCDS